ncbi:hypothetical protein Z043_104319 [Scleropages formosus]|uniref:CAP-Gly domain-containing protein n=1 Tax=Scleropages formosus TaxID=113540 RepID=A0A0P7XM80_SCLFO|nr:hypothetical protein Z043_104319 [Scleropages formosus]
MRVETPDRGAVAEPLPSEALGRRVSCDGERATVRYVGAKHDGSHEGVRYFTCRFPTGGSFVRPKKASFGMSYVAALRQRYEGDVGCVDGEKLKISTRTVEMVGFEDLSKKKK